MKFKMVHSNRNVFDLEKSLKFYKDALGFTEARRIAPADGSFIVVFLKDELSADGAPAFRLELTWLKERDTPYELGDNEIHLAVSVEDFNAAYTMHKGMNCICYENLAMGIYFIADPDGYWVEILPKR
ncbi:MAG: VOC family protein [Clostridiales bacterium]|nr:VOC family protein [Clostridiales bacterium]